MDLQFLGTAAAEGVPALFCECDTCNFSRKNGGRDIRRRASLLINNDLLIDCGPDTSWAAANFGLSLATLRYLLVTHSHFDHWYPENLEIRSRRYRARYRHYDPLPGIRVIGGPSTLSLLARTALKDDDMELSRHPILPGDSIECLPYSVTAVRARHALNLGDAVNYVVKDPSATILYATDTGLFFEDAWTILEKQGCDAVILEMTNGTGSTSPNHLNIDGVQSMISELQSRGVIVGGAPIFLTHFSHMNNPPHDDLIEIAKPLGAVPAYDGLCHRIMKHS